MGLTETFKTLGKYDLIEMIKDKLMELLGAKIKYSPGIFFMELIEEIWEWTANQKLEEYT